MLGSPPSTVPRSWRCRHPARWREKVQAAESPGTQWLANDSRPEQWDASHPCGAPVPSCGKYASGARQTPDKDKRRIFLLYTKPGIEATLAFNVMAERLTWTDDRTELMLKEFVKIAKRGAQAQPQSFKTADHRAVGISVNQTCSTAHFHAERVRNRYNVVKARWKLWSIHLKHTSGWCDGDPGTGPRCGDPEAEDVHFKEHPECRPFRNALPKRFEECEFLFGNKLATGGEAIDPAALTNSSDAAERGDKDGGTPATAAAGDDEELPWSSSDAEQTPRGRAHRHNVVMRARNRALDAERDNGGP